MLRLIIYQNASKNILRILGYIKIHSKIYQKNILGISGTLKTYRYSQNIPCKNFYMWLIWLTYMSHLCHIYVTYMSHIYVTYLPLLCSFLHGYINIIKTRPTIYKTKIFIWTQISSDFSVNQSVNQKYKCRKVVSKSCNTKVVFSGSF